jgi:hypothetical protein
LQSPLSTHTHTHTTHLFLVNTHIFLNIRYQVLDIERKKSVIFYTFLISSRLVSSPPPPLPRHGAQVLCYATHAIHNKKPKAESLGERKRLATLETAKTTKAKEMRKASEEREGGKKAVPERY